MNLTANPTANLTANLTAFSPFRTIRAACVAAITCSLVSLCSLPVLAQTSGIAPLYEDGRTLFDYAPWYMSLGVGQVNFEGDEEVEDGNLLNLRLGYNLNSRFALEGLLDIMPSLDGRSGLNPDRNRLGGVTGTEPSVEDTWAARVALDGFYHLRSVQNLRFDPYVGLGAGFIHFDEDVDGGSTEFMVTGGGGLFYHFSDTWALRGDVQTTLVGPDTEANVIYTIGGNYRLGAPTPPIGNMLFTGEGNLGRDSDGDMLSDEYENSMCSDPNNPDTDGDGLTDGEEVLKYKTDPCNPDSDGDGISDGDEIRNGTDPNDPYNGRGAPKAVLPPPPPPPPPDPSTMDSDGDGLSDADEARYGTDPNNADTDGDGLSDGDEVLTYKSDPLNPDSDYDLLKDGDEVFKYRTDPTNPDTDGGGVGDGHEVLEDETNPLDPSDDFMLFELDLEFDYDKSIVRPNDFDELDRVGKVLARFPGTTAVVEGHADKRPSSKRDYNISLSQRRAAAVKQYFADRHGIAPNRIQTKGYGFDRPKAPNDTEANMQRNRRVEVYIDGVPPEFKNRFMR